MKRTLIYVMLGATLLLNSSFLTRAGQASKRGMLSFVDYKGSTDIYLIDSTGENFQKLTTDDTPKISSNPVWVPEPFFSVSPSIEKQSVVWGRLKASEINTQ